MAIGPYHLLQCFISACSAYHEGFLVGRDPKHVLVNGHVLMARWNSECSLRTSNPGILRRPGSSFCSPISGIVFSAFAASGLPSVLADFLRL
ncbi:hypothetical protein ARMSODRAFT_947311 [Armillaria solidipes]|uniref:Uncharacterized protein n=1 Tax=Armillaria solidipes TaxID=1076256 RepID=A0A2H3CGS6_9AGAR|nr:hypothetical protein ARMSODRAFT_947311 [Armillaria solidipes]